MKKVMLLASLLFISSNSFSDELHNFNEIKASAMTGKPLHIAVDVLKCSPSNASTETFSIASFTPDTLQIMNGSIATSFTHFTLNNPSFLDKPVYEFVRYTMSDDNNLNLIIQVLDAVNYTSLSGKFTLNCKIGSAARFYN